MEVPTAFGPGSLLGLLRTAIRPAHEALEGVLGLLAPDLGVLAYTDVLRRLYGFWSIWEPQMAVTLDDTRLFEPRRRLHLLSADLMALGHSRSALSALANCLPIDVGSNAAAIGSLYVMEGSTLGGKIIERNLARCLGPQIARSYFIGYGSNTGRMWRDLLAVLDTVPASRAEQAVSGASATFERLGRWLAPR